MATITIRNLDDSVRRRLKERAAANDRSMEAEVRAILGEAVGGWAPIPGLGQALLELGRKVGGVELDIPPRTDTPRSVDFE
ncbi:MAG TPA: Arc family DNA-binding protein [Nocardioidaceae bacterium]|nr:Arc family DNA-binding protein [Nocardioidaceae bacterium]